MGIDRITENIYYVYSLSFEEVKNGSVDQNAI